MVDNVANSGKKGAIPHDNGTNSACGTVGAT